MEGPTPLTTSITSFPRAHGWGAALCALALASCSGDDVADSATEGASSSSSSSSSSSTGESASAGSSASGTASTSTTGASGSASDGETTGTSGGATTGTSGTTGVVEPGCGDGVLDPGEACDDGNDDDFDGCKSDCTAVELLDPPALEWKYYEIPGTTCLSGKPAGFAVSHNPDSKDLMLYLEGGGACFNDACDFTAFNIPFVAPIDGIFSRSNDANPVRDWTMVYVPYCTGDIHAGDKDTELGGQLRYFHGYTNITRYLEILVPSFPVERVLLTGISAGGFGAALNSTQVADAYGEGVELTVVDDSGPPLSNKVIAPCLQAIFHEVWGLDNTILAACPECSPDDFATDLLAHVIDGYPALRYALFSNTGDQIIRTYMGAGWGNAMYDKCDGISTPVPIKAYSDDLDAIRAKYEEAISTFYYPSIGHTVLRVSYYVTAVGGTSVPQWLADVLDGQITHVGP